MNYLRFFLVATAYLVSGAVILKCLSKLKMRIASCVFLVLFFVGSLYIPIVCGAEAMCRLLTPMLPGIFDLDTFIGEILSPSCVLFPYFSIVAVLFFAFALILVIALVIVTVFLVRRVMRLMRCRLVCDRPRKVSVLRIVQLPAKTRRIYIEFYRLLN